MRVDVILRYVGMAMLFVASAMLVSACISLAGGDDSAFYALLLSSLLTALLGVFPLIFVKPQEHISNKEGFGIVVGSWLLACVVGMFPYLIWGGEFTLMNAWFESVSGFTATGATILNDIEGLPRGLLFWRTASAWIGGMGVVMFALLILPSLGSNKMRLSNVEQSPLAKDNYQYRTHIIVRILLVVYVGITLISTLLLKLAGMGWFDALCHAMSACSTSGLSTKDTSIAFYDSAMIDVVLMLTMILGGMHFGVIYATVTGKSNNMFRSEVTRWYFGVLLTGGVLIAVSLFGAGLYSGLKDSLRFGFFQFVSAATSTGFNTANFTQWTPFAIALLLFAGVSGACAGSTTGGLKLNRVVLAVKIISARIRRQQHPNAVIRIRLDGVLQDEESLHAVMVFVVAYVMLIFAGTFFGTITGADLTTSFAGAVSSVSNLGAGMGNDSELITFASTPGAFKLLNSLLMLFGRLEIFGLIQFCFIKWWR